MDLEPQEISLEVFRERYAFAGETTLAALHLRVASALAAVEHDVAYWQAQFFQVLQDGLIPGGRINYAAGTGMDATLLNCFVQPVGDSIESIELALREAAETMRFGGGVGYNFSALPPAGSKGFGLRTLPPVPCLQLFDASCKAIESISVRRGAQMGVLNCDHPDIDAFIHAKDQGGLCNFNLSIGATNRFMQSVADDAEWALIHAAAPDPFVYPHAERCPDGRWRYRTVRARDLWAQIMAAAYAHAEPGILFLDKINRDNNLSYCEQITATNPCGEQPLPDYASCDLASINLTRLVLNPFAADARFDFAALARMARVAVRLLDNVYDITRWPLPQQRHEALQKRRLGLGFLGQGDALIMLGLRYDSPDARQMAACIAETLRNEAYLASTELAREKGAFSLFCADRVLSGEHSANRLPEYIKDLIRRNGLRNSHLTCIAPTGTISLALADNASNGIEPAYAWLYRRNRQMPAGGLHACDVEDYAHRLYRSLGGDIQHLPPTFVSALELHVLDHMRMVAAVQPYVDAGISKTVNVAKDVSFVEFESLYFEAWRAGLKGITTFRPNTVISAVLFRRG